MKTNSINITSKIHSALQQKLKPGQTVKAQVVKSEGRQVLLQLGTNILKARTQVSLKTGERLQLQVESAQGRAVELKIIKDATQLKPENTTLGRLGLKPQEEMYRILRQLVRFNLPVSQASILEIYNLINRFKFNNELTQLAIWLKTFGIKVESEKDFNALQTFHEFLKRELPVNNEERFFNFLNDTESIIFGGYNIYSWSISGQHVFLVAPGSKRERLQPENCTLLLHLNSHSFEELWVKLELNRNTLKAGIICSNDKNKTILSQEVKGLSAALQVAGYNIDSVKVEVSREKLTILDFLPQQTPHLYDVNYQV